jgi:hypothetical protein
VYASSFGDSLSGSGNWGLKVANALKGGKGLYGQSTNTDGGGIGVQGVSTGRTGRGVYGVSTGWRGRGVYGLASRGGGKSIGVFGESKSNQGKGVMGFASKASGTTYGVYGRANSPSGWGLYTPNKAYVGNGLMSNGKIEVVMVDGNDMVAVRRTGTSRVGYALGTNGSGDHWWITLPTGTSNQLRFYNVDAGLSKSMVINQDTGNVGIGTASPAQKLEVTSIMRLTPTDDVNACTASTKGSIYYDASLSELCDCNGVSWAQVDGGGSC